MDQQLEIQAGDTTTYKSNLKAEIHKKTAENTDNYKHPRGSAPTLAALQSNETPKRVKAVWGPIRPLLC